MSNTRLYGSDPEIGIVSEGILIPPAYLFEQGMGFTTNKNNKKVILESSYGQVIEDGVSFEFNPKPASTATNLFMSIMKLRSSLISAINDFMRTVNMYKFVDYTTKCMYEFDFERFLGNDSSLYDDCRQFRCDQDFYPSIYKELGLETVDGVVDASKHPLRYFGGHIHIQNISNNDKVYEENAQYAPIVFDFLVGLTNVANIAHSQSKNDIKLEITRMNVYGRPGRGRIQKYSNNSNGYEYRPPSNNWTFSVETANKLFSMANMAAGIVESGRASDFTSEVFQHIPDMWETILTMNGDMADKLLKVAMKTYFKFRILKLYEIKGAY